MKEVKVYLVETDFIDYGEGYGYDVRVTSHGVRVSSHCCAEDMDDDVALKLRDALIAYFNDKAIEEKK